ncbi:MAG: PD40 domain-containing protein [SAR324 cluster bacterium]|nr:PD40 domain-containing protein [SAR324 cluster bacterium]
MSGLRRQTSGNEMLVKYTNAVCRLGFCRKTGWIFLYLVMFAVFSASPVSAIEYIEITNPKFVPLKVGLLKNARAELLPLQEVIKANLEKTLYFQIIYGTKASFEQAEEISFQLDLAQKNDSSQLEITLRTPELKKPLSQQSFPLPKQEDLRMLGLQLADWFVEKTLKFKGVSASRIAYTAQKAKRRKNIMLSSYDGTLQKRFSYNLGSNNLSSWSFDSQNIIYTTLTRSSAQLAIQPAIRLRAKIFTFPSGFQPLGASWNPDGKSILLTLMKKGNADIYSYQLADAKLERIFAWKSLETSPQVSPDGRKLAFVSDSARPRRPQIYLHDFLSHKTERITFRGNYNSSPKWSPDGTKLVYERQKKGFFQIFKYNLLTRRHLQLTFGRYDSEKPDWSPNGKQLVFSAKKKNGAKLYYMSSLGGRTVRVTTNPPSISETNPVWSK